MSILKSVVYLTEGVEGLSGVHDGLKKLIDADGAVETHPITHKSLSPGRNESRARRC